MRRVLSRPELVREFFRTLLASRLVPLEEVDRLMCRLEGKDLPAISEALVEEAGLTPYQVQRLLEGRPEGLVLGQYRILDELGRGGFGQVYKAVHAIMGRVVALKSIAPEWVQDREVRDLFLREVLAITRLVHPNIALAYDANEIDGTLFFAMEFVEGPNLEQLIDDLGPLPLPVASAVIQQTALALQFAHDNGMVHRDIKPANLLLAGAHLAADPASSPSGLPPVRVKVVDFGLARLYPRGGTGPNTIIKNPVAVGTPAFMSPEQAQNFHDVDIRSDLYSLGCTFYYVLTGHLPFGGTTTLEFLTGHLGGDPVPVQRWRPDIPPGVAAIVHRLMAKKPEQRFQTPAELLAELSFALRADRPEDVRGTEPRRSVAPALSFIAAQPPSDPSAGAPEATGADVHAMWRQWCGVVEALLLDGRCDVDEGAYRSLHRSLLAALRNRTASPHGPPPDLLGQLEGVVEPWLASHTLASLDRKVLARLWQTCQELGAEWMPPRKKPFAAVGAYALAAAVLLGLLGSGLLFPANGLLAAARALWETARANPLLAVAGSVPVAALALVLSRIPRR
jgi:serine/threonine protein kinase